MKTTHLPQTIIRPSTLPILFQIAGTMLVVSTLIVFFANAYWLSTLTSAFALGLAARGVTLLFGQLGLVSLCQVALVGVGGWIALRLSHGTDMPIRTGGPCRGRRDVGNRDALGGACLARAGPLSGFGHADACRCVSDRNRGGGVP